MVGDRSLKYQPALDGLRAVAVGAVLLYHLGGRVRTDVAHGGFLGVDIFFVLSGYLITTLLLEERFATGAIRLGGFWARRAPSTPAGARRAVAARRGARLLRVSVGAASGRARRRPVRDRVPAELAPGAVARLGELAALTGVVVVGRGAVLFPVARRPARAGGGPRSQPPPTVPHDGRARRRVRDLERLPLRGGRWSRLHGDGHACTRVVRGRGARGARHRARPHGRGTATAVARRRGSGLSDRHRGDARERPLRIAVVLRRVRAPRGRDRRGHRGGRAAPRRRAYGPRLPGARRHRPHLLRPLPHPLPGLCVDGDVAGSRTRAAPPRGVAHHGGARDRCRSCSSNNPCGSAGSERRWPCRSDSGSPSSRSSPSPWSRRLPTDPRRAHAVLAYVLGKAAAETPPGRKRVSVLGGNRASAAEPLDEGCVRRCRDPRHRRGHPGLRPHRHHPTVPSRHRRPRRVASNVRRRRGGADARRAGHRRCRERPDRRTAAAGRARRLPPRHDRTTRG